MTNTSQPNHLAGAANAYLAQHGEDLTNWYPWGEEAFSRAVEEKKLIFLSIGYLTCPYSHKMQSESFNDPEVAALLNDNFIAIKVDREERPDINHVFMMIVQHMTGRGGWPMHVLLTPDLLPVFSATYLPKQGYGNVPGLIDLLPLMSDLWRDQPLAVTDNAKELLQTISTYIQPQAGESTNHRDLDIGVDRLELIFDANYGGFGPAPKFPLPQNLLLLMRYADLNEVDEAWQIAEKTLKSMYQGGIYDHIGFGFYRYSTDPIWMIPRFEKRLSDNALLAYSYLKAYQLTDRSMFARIAKETLTYLLRDLSAAEGGFFTAESAEKEGAQGLYYLWDEAEIKELLGFEADMIIEYYNIGQAGTLQEFGKTLPNLLYKELDEAKLVFLERHRQTMLAVREKRERPLIDCKILARDNGLAIGALALAARILPKDEGFLAAAEQAVAFIQKNMLSADGYLVGCYDAGRTDSQACAADYAYLIWGLTELHQTTLKLSYLELIVKLQEQMMELFWDTEQGGFFFTPEPSAEKRLMFRPKSFYDTDLPCDNSVAALNLLRLAQLTGNTEWMKLGKSQFETFGLEIRQNPTACSFWLYAASYYLYSSNQIIITGDQDDETLQGMIYLLHTYGGERWLLLLLENADDYQAAQKFVPYLQKVEWDPSIQGGYIVEQFVPAVKPLKSVEDVRFAIEQRSQFNRLQ